MANTPCNFQYDSATQQDIGMNIFVSYRFGGYVNLGDGDNWKCYNTAAPTAKFYYLTEGEIVIEANGQKHSIGPYDLVYVPEKLTHSFYKANPEVITKKYWAHILLRIGNVSEALISNNIFVFRVPAEDRKYVKSVFKSIIAPRKNLSDILMQRAHIIELYAYCLSHRSVQKPQRVSKNAERFQEVFEYIEKNLHKRITTKELANIMHFNSNYFIGIFKQYTGVTPHRYIADTKCNRAMQLLSNTTLSVSSIMLETGFDDPNVFLRFFKKNTGYSPTNFRKSTFIK